MKFGLLVVRLKVLLQQVGIMTIMLMEQIVLYNSIIFI